MEVFKLSFLQLILSLSISCEKDDAPDLDEYFVKYEVVASSISDDPNLIEVTITNQEGNKTSFSPGRSFETNVFVKKGFNAQLDVNSISMPSMQSMQSM